MTTNDHSNYFDGKIEMNWIQIELDSSGFTFPCLFD